MPKPSATLGELWLYTNDDCNLRCRHCLIKPGTHRPPLARLQTRVREAQEAGASDFYLTGGEPFLRDDLEDLLAYTTERGTTVVLTNATLITPERLTRLDRLLKPEHKARLTFQVSIDGPREIHDRQRGNGSFDRARAGVRALTDWDCPPALTTALTTLNCESVHQVTELAHDWGCQVQHLFLPHVRARMRADVGQLRPDNDALLAALRATRGRAAELGIILSNQAVITGRVNHPERFHLGCTGGDSMLAVAADDSIAPCPSLVGQTELSDPPGTTLRAALTAGRVRRMAAVTPHSKPRCSRCRLAAICGAGCAAYAYNEHAAYCGIDPYCEVYRAFITDTLQAKTSVGAADPCRPVSALPTQSSQSGDPSRHPLQPYRFGCT